MGAARERDSNTVDVADTLERIRAGLRQRRSELAALDAHTAPLPGPLAEVRAQAQLEEPSFYGEGGSRLQSFLQKVIYHLFSKRHHRSLLRQQSRFNRSVDLALAELFDRQERLAAQLERLRRNDEDGGNRTAAP